MAAVVQVVEQTIETYGFVKRNMMWQRDLPHLFQIAKVAGSRFGGRHYLEIGVVLKEAMSEAKVSKTPMDWHVYARGEELYADRKQAHAAMDDDEPLDDADRYELIHSIVKNAWTNFFETLSTPEDVLRLAKGEFNPKMKVNMEIRNFASTKAT